MAQLLSERTASAYEEALAIMRENAKYNIGDVYRTINLPLQALDLLHPQYRTRFDFKAAGRERVGGQEAAIVAFQERSTPTTLVSDGFGGELLARGRVWIEPTSGAVLRTELSFNGTAARYLKESAIRVDYQRDTKLHVATSNCAHSARRAGRKSRTGEQASCSRVVEAVRSRRYPRPRSPCDAGSGGAGPSDLQPRLRRAGT